MKPLHSSRRWCAAFTLAEMLVAGGAASILLGGLMMGTVALQRSFAASGRVAAAQSDLARVADYMAKDIHNATQVSTASAPALLTVTTAEYTPSASPTLGRTGVTYGTNPVKIRYVKNDRRILREVTRGATVSTTWIADFVDNLTVSTDAAGNVTITAASALCYGQRPSSAKVPASALLVTTSSRNPNL